MWIQPQTKIKEIPMPNVLFVNDRGRVLSVVPRDVKEAEKKGYKLAPKGSFAGQYIVELDSSIPPKEVKAETKPKRKRKK